VLSSKPAALPGTPGPANLATEAGIDSIA